MPATKNLTLPTVVLALVLAACGGGSDQTIPRSAVAQPADSKPTFIEVCPAPVTADCVSQAASQNAVLQMTGGRESDYSLIVHEGALHLIPQPGSANGLPSAAVDFRFRGGVTIEDGSVLEVHRGSRLHSDVVVQSTGRLFLNGGATMTGNATNHGNMTLWSLTGNATNHGNMTLIRSLIGDLVNNSSLTPGGSIYEEGETTWRNVEGAFQQASAGTLDAMMGVTAGGFVSVTGRADIDGTLRLINYEDGWGPYPLPVAPFTVHVLHADGGVYGRFTNLASPGLLVTGNFRYLANDIFFDVTAISAAK